MTDEIEEAIEAACSAGGGRSAAEPGRAMRRVSVEVMRAMVKEFLRNAPEGMTVQEILDEL